MQEHTDWYVVAGPSHARVLSQARDGEVTLLHEFRRRRADRHFARSIAQFLEREAHAARFARLSIFAPSPFLGELKLSLGASSVHRLVDAQDVDLSRVPLAQLQARMARQPASAGS